MRPSWAEWAALVSWILALDTAKDDLFLKGHGRPTVPRPYFLINLIIFDLQQHVMLLLNVFGKFNSTTDNLFCVRTFYQKFLSTNCSIIK